VLFGWSEISILCCGNIICPEIYVQLTQWSLVCNQEFEVGKRFPRSNLAFQLLARILVELIKVGKVVP
jgi:hypothetical protein